MDLFTALFGPDPAVEKMRQKLLEIKSISYNELYMRPRTQQQTRIWLNIRHLLENDQVDEALQQSRALSASVNRGAPCPPLRQIVPIFQSDGEPQPPTAGQVVSILWLLKQFFCHS